MTGEEMVRLDRLLKRIEKSLKDAIRRQAELDGEIATLKRQQQIVLRGIRKAVANLPREERVLT